MSIAWRKKAISTIAESRKSHATASDVVDKPKSGSMIVDKCIEKCNHSPSAHEHKFGKKPIITYIG